MRWLAADLFHPLHSLHAYVVHIEAMLLHQSIPDFVKVKQNVEDVLGQFLDPCEYGGCFCRQEGGLWGLALQAMNQPVPFFFHAPNARV
jgi:hypothetical protein